MSLRTSYGLFIGGEWHDPADGGSFKTVAPATEETLAERIHALEHMILPRTVELIARSVRQRPASDRP